MAREKLKSLITSFSPEGDFLAILSPNGVVKIWNTSNGNLFADWKQSDEESDISFSYMACSFVGKKRRKESATFLLALGTDAGEILSINVLTGERKWKSTECHPGGIAGLSFANRGRSLYTVGSNGMASEMNSVTGERVREFKVSKTVISSACFCDEKMLAIASDKIRVLSLENGKELLNFSADLAPVKYISISNEAKAIVTSGSGEKQLQVWMCDLSARAVSKGPILSMKQPPILVDCRNGCNGEDSVAVLSVSESGVAYIWNLKGISQEEINPTKVTVKANNAEMDLQNKGSSRKSRTPIVAARLHALELDGQVTVLVAYGSVDSPQFSLLDISNPGEDIVIAAREETTKTTETVQENGVLPGKENLVTGLDELELEAVGVPIQKKKTSKKRAAADPDLTNTENSVDNGHGEPMDGVQIDDDLNEPTMGEKLATLNLLDNNEVKSIENQESSPRTKPPSADSIHVLLKQALHADDRALLSNCLYTHDEKVIANSVSLLNPSDVLKLLDFLISITQSRGGMLASALPWLRSLLLQHASGIMSQESSLLALNSLYQLIESRVSTFHPALQLSSCLDLLYTASVDDVLDEDDIITPIIFEDKDESDVEESEDAMETDEDGNDIETFTDVSDIEGSDGMSI
ncbi:hypothetical protein F0562_023033 [Nyssa sinensis]|uniref:Small-subunit processome Utp12 domain-containing protein n=1 Tax=Nyssa sinensis TaxID=561372 RepID=A0A5J5BL55_9ASTE|nr:hypothetical protein F0562_023033 [Nyssa sinensis]